MADIQQIRVQIPEDLEPRYVNVAYITHTPSEFLLDFVTMLPGLTNPKVNTRLLLSPLGMKLVQRALNEMLNAMKPLLARSRSPRARPWQTNSSKAPERRHLVRKNKNGHPR